MSIYVTVIVMVTIAVVTSASLLLGARMSIRYRNVELRTIEDVFTSAHERALESFIRITTMASKSDELRTAQSADTLAQAINLFETSVRQSVRKDSMLEELISQRNQLRLDPPKSDPLMLGSRSENPGGSIAEDPLEAWERSLGDARVEFSSTETFSVPIAVYTSGTHVEGEQLANAVFALLSEYGFELEWQSRAEAGSWFRTFRARLRKAASREEVAERLKKLENAVQLEILDKRRAEVDKAKAEAIACVVNSISQQKEAVVRIGSVVVIKEGDRLFAETISERAARQLEDNSVILRNPRSAEVFFQALDNGKKHQEAVTGLGELEEQEFGSN